MKIKKPIAKLGAKETRIGVEPKKRKLKTPKKIYSDFFNKFNRFGYVSSLLTDKIGRVFEYEADNLKQIENAIIYLNSKNILFVRNKVNWYRRLERCYKLFLFSLLGSLKTIFLMSKSNIDPIIARLLYRK